MSLTFGLSSARDLFAKLQRDADALEEEVTSDRFFNFVVTAYSLIDWVFHDPATPAAARPKVDRIQQGLDSLCRNKWLKICRDLSNSCKHFKLNYTPKTTSATSVQGFGLGRFGKGRFGIGEESIEVRLDDGTTFHCLDLVKNVIETWQTFFKSHGMKA